MSERSAISTEADSTAFAAADKTYGATNTSEGTSAAQDDVSYGDDEPLTRREDLCSNSYERNLFLYHEEMPERPRVANLLSSITHYNAIIPSVTESRVPVQSANLGTIAGVYLPCIQNILGVMFFLRLSWIVGTAGTHLALLIVILACSVTFTTIMSLSAIATNGYVPAGGSYFMISRALGPEFGGAVGILFYLATTMAGSLYITGAIEIFMSFMVPNFSLFGDPLTNPSASSNNSRVFGTILLAIIGAMVLVGVKFVSKLAPVALLCVFISVLAVYAGVFVKLHGDQDYKICVLGSRLLYETRPPSYTCSKDPNDTSSLYHVYCSTVDGNVTCSPYYESHDVHEELAIPGLASGVFSKNTHSYFFHAGDYISDEEGPRQRMSKGEKVYNQIIMTSTTSFALLIGVFFPSATGIMAGSNRSGDLADASKSIPAGTLAAHITTTLIYLSGVFFFGGSFSQLYMRDKFGNSLGGSLAVANLAWPHPLVVIIGSFLSTFGAALQCLVGAPRLLQAIAQDQIIPILNPFAKSSVRNEPVRALVITLVVCEMGILIGNLDLIAPIQTMFFLMCYMFVNLACVLQSLLRTPHWRPRFKFYHWTASMLGSFLCLVVMFLINWYYALVAMIIALLAYKYIEYRGAEKEWGDGIRGLALSAARYSLLRVEEGPPHTKNWRPQILILSKLDENLNPKYPKLFTFASQLKAGQGLTMACSVIEGQYHQMHSEAQAAKLSLKKAMEQKKVEGFAEILVAKDINEGICSLIQTAGLGGMKHNTVVLGWPYGWRQSPDEMSWKLFLSTIRSVSASKKALLVPKGINFFPESHEKMRGTIDVWWIVHDGGLLMLLPFLLMQHKTWRNCKLRVFTVAQEEDNSEQMRKDLAKFLYQLRINAEVEVVQMSNTDISAYTYERTRLMEQRNEILNQLHLEPAMKAGELQFTDVQDIVDHHHRMCIDASGQVVVRDNQEEFTFEEDNEEELVECSELPPLKSKSRSKNSKSRSSASLKDVLKIRPDKINVRRMHTAVKLNEEIVARSHNAQLVILNLPGVPKGQTLKSNYMEFLEVLTEGLERVLMVRGGGREVITIYS